MEADRQLEHDRRLGAAAAASRWQLNASGIIRRAAGVTASVDGTNANQRPSAGGAARGARPMRFRPSPGPGIVLLFSMSVASSPATASDARHPTVVELFQSQGCSSCLPANANVMSLADRPDLLTLSWQVTYWDYLGWKDTFDSPAFTQRQRDYASRFGRNEVFTPEVVVNGRSDVVGDDRDMLAALIRSNDRGDAGPSVTLAGGNATVAGAKPAGKAMVLLVRYDPAIIQVPISRGENGGLTLPHRNVVRQVVALGDWTGGSQVFAVPSSADPRLKSAILVQMGAGGAIIAAARG